MFEPRGVRVQAVITRPPSAPGTVAPHPAPVQSWPGTLLDWRWVDQAAGTWTGLVRYSREGLAYEHWIHGDLLDVAPVSSDEGTALES